MCGGVGSCCFFFLCTSRGDVSRRSLVRLGGWHGEGQKGDVSAESRARGPGTPAVAACWCPAHPRCALVGRGGLGSAGQRLGAGALSGLLAACWVTGHCWSRERR